MRSGWRRPRSSVDGGSSTIHGSPSPTGLPQRFETSFEVRAIRERVSDSARWTKTQDDIPSFADGGATPSRSTLHGSRSPRAERDRRLRATSSSRSTGRTVVVAREHSRAPLRRGFVGQFSRGESTTDQASPGPCERQVSPSRCQWIFSLRRGLRTEGTALSIIASSARRSLTTCLNSCSVGQTFPSSSSACFRSYPSRTSGPGT